MNEARCNSRLAPIRIILASLSSFGVMFQRKASCKERGLPKGGVGSKRKNKVTTRPVYCGRFRMIRRSEYESKGCGLTVVDEGRRPSCG